MGLVVLRQVRLLPETLTAEAAGEGFLPRVRPDVDVHRVLVLEALRADAAVVQRALLPDPVAGGGRALHGGLALGAPAGPLVLLRRRLAAGHDGGRRYRNRGAQVVQQAYLLGGDAVNRVFHRSVYLTVLVHGFRHLVRYPLQLLEVFRETRKEDVVHAVVARWWRFTFGLSLGYVFLEDHLPVGVNSSHDGGDLIRVLLYKHRFRLLWRSGQDPPQFLVSFGLLRLDGAVVADEGFTLQRASEEGVGGAVVGTRRRVVVVAQLPVVVVVVVEALVSFQHGRVYDEGVGQVIFVVRETAVLVAVGFGLDEAVGVRSAQGAFS